MKRILLLTSAIFLLLNTNCKKEKEEEPLLSDFIIGYWESQILELWGKDYIYCVIFTEDGQYQLTMVEGLNGIPCSGTGYTLNDTEKTIVLDLPFCAEPGPVIPSTPYDVSMVNSDMMEWTEHDGDSETTTITWTRQDDNK